MKLWRAWIVLNLNGNPIVGAAESVFETKAEALKMARLWEEGAHYKNSPNRKLSVHRVTLRTAS